MGARVLEIGGKLRHLSGWRASRPDRRRASLYLAPPPEGENYDLLADSVDLEPFMPPVNDQGAKGTCLANSTCEILEFLERPENPSDPAAWRPYSRDFVYAVGRQEEGIPLTEDSGLDMHATWTAIQRTGICLESTMPYIPSVDDEPTDTARAEALLHRPPLGYFCPDLFTLLARVAAGFPVAFGMALPENFMSMECLATGIVKIPGPNEGYIGGHSMAVIGYHKIGVDPQNWLLKVRNSWGYGVGVRGNFFIPGWYWLNEQTNVPLAGDNLTILRAA